MVAADKGLAHFFCFRSLDSVLLKVALLHHYRALQVRIVHDRLPCWRQVWRCELEVLEIAHNCVLYSPVIDEVATRSVKLILLNVADVLCMHHSRMRDFRVLTAEAQAAFEAERSVVFLALSMHRMHLINCVDALRS